MTEAEWLRCRQPRDLLRALRAHETATDRKLHLLAAACCRLVWPLLPEACRRAVELTERLADHPADDQDLVPIVSAAVEAACGVAEPAANLASEMAYRSASLDGWYAAAVVGHGPDATGEVARLRDIFGNPFRPATLDFFLLNQDDGLSALAREAYEDRDLPSGHLALARLAAMADALERAGCTASEVLGHLRGPGPHVRGCWVVDAALGLK